MTVVNRFVQAVAHGGLMAKPTLIVIHSAETPLRAGYAKSIAENWFGKSATTSAHFMVDPIEIIRMLSDNVVSYAVGPRANGFTLNIEQAGYARLTRAEWTTPDGLTQHRKVGALVSELAAVHNIPKRWATDDQIRAAARGIPGGVCFHDDIARVLGGTTHTDPIPNYPAALVEQAWSGDVQEDDMFDPTTDGTRLIRIEQLLSGSLGEALARIDLAAARLEDEDSQTDLLLWAVADPTNGLRTQVASLQGQVEALAAALGQVSGGSGLDVAVLKQVADDAASKAASKALGGLADRLKPSA